VGLDGFVFVVIDRPGPEVVLRHAEGVLDPPQVVVGADHPGRVRVDDVGDVRLPASQRAGLRLKVPIDRRGATGEGDKPVPFDRCLPGDGLLTCAN
jgi:hypothetical protein